MSATRIVLAAAAVSLALSAWGEPQVGRIPGLGGRKDDAKKEQERDRKQQERDARNLSRYEKLKEYSLNRYQSDPDFREEVDQSYGNLLRDHSVRAYEKNITRDSFIRTVHEDNWRVHVNLYDNLRVQDHVNRIGQRLVPADSEHLYAFKVVPDPIPSAETLATGTIYVSTGLISMLDSEAQLAYVLAHEMAHVHHQHWKERVMMDSGEDAMASDQARRVAKWGLLGSIAGAGAGAAIGRSGGAAVTGAAIGGGAGLIAGLLLNRPLVVDWDRVEEDKADELAFKQTLEVNYDVRETPKLYLALEKAVTRDTRVGLGFLGSRQRVKQRRERCENLIAGAFKADIEARLKKGFVGGSAEHQNLMAELKRDNGIMAYYHDMFDMARTNLSEAVAIRNNDAAVHYFYGKVLKLVGRTEEEQRLAVDSFRAASQHDYRKQNYGSHLHQALFMLQDRSEKNMNIDNKKFSQELDSYVTNYARWAVESGQLRMFPPNLDVIYEYMRLFGDQGWRPKPPEIKDLAPYAAYYALSPDLGSPYAVRDTSAGRTNVPAPGSAPDNTVNQVIQQGINTVGSTPTRTGAAVRTVEGVKQTVPKKK
ncbi:MAG: M48 family metalloprotease [Bryobacteraceae bacterium]